MKKTATSECNKSPFGVLRRNMATLLIEKQVTGPFPAISRSIADPVRAAHVIGSGINRLWFFPIERDNGSLIWSQARLLLHKGATRLVPFLDGRKQAAEPKRKLVGIVHVDTHDWIAVVFVDGLLLPDFAFQGLAGLRAFLGKRFEKPDPDLVLHDVKRPRG